MNIAVKQFDQAKAAPVIAPKFSIDLSKDGWDLIVTVELADGNNNEYRLNFDSEYSPDGAYIYMDDTCELAVIDCETGKETKSEIKTPDWIDVHVAPEVSRELAESAYNDYINNFEY